MRYEFKFVIYLMMINQQNVLILVKIIFSRDN